MKKLCIVGVHIVLWYLVGGTALRDKYAWVRGKLRRCHWCIVWRSLSFKTNKIFFLFKLKWALVLSHFGGIHTASANSCPTNTSHPSWFVTKWTTKSRKKWGKYLQIDNIHWQDHYEIICKIWHETYLQTFQYRIFPFFPLQLYLINMVQK